MPPAQFSMSDDDGAALMSGPIGVGSARNFAALMQHAPNLRVLTLESPGGSVDEARRIAQIVRQKGMDTYVSRSCASACTLIFYAGQTRWINPNGKLGFHSYSSVGAHKASADQLEKSEDVERKAYSDGGIPDWFITHIFQTPASTIWRPSRQELLDSGFVTGISSDLPDHAAPQPVRVVTEAMRVVKVPDAMAPAAALPSVITP